MRGTSRTTAQASLFVRSFGPGRTGVVCAAQDDSAYLGKCKLLSVSSPFPTAPVAVSTRILAGPRLKRLLKNAAGMSSPTQSFQTTKSEFKKQSAVFLRKD